MFGPVWTVLYVLMAIAAWRVWRAADRDTRRGPLTLFALQLALTLGWTVVFFGLEKIGAALATIVVLDVGVVVTTLAFRPRFNPRHASWRRLSSPCMAPPPSRCGSALLRQHRCSISLVTDLAATRDRRIRRPRSEGAIARRVISVS